MSATDFRWYEIVDGGDPILQGDFISNCPVVVPVPDLKKDSEVRTEVQEFDVVIMSQSCDLAQGKIDLVQVCPVWSLTEFCERGDNFFKSRQGKNELRKGNTPGYHLMKECDLKGFETEHLVADFRSVYGVPLKQLREIARLQGNRKRLLPPYREHLSQAFARFFMRVGLPTDIPEFR
jgi:hypothetical protein